MVYFTMVQDRDSRLLERSLESLTFAEAGTFNDLDDIHPTFFTGRAGSGTVAGDSPKFVDISAGSFGSPLTIVAFDVLTSPAVELRNFTAEEVVVTANARPFVQIPPLSAVPFSVDGFGTPRVGLSLGDSPLTRLDLPFDLTWRSPLEAIEMTSGLKAPDS